MGAYVVNFMHGWSGLSFVSATQAKLQMLAASTSMTSNSKDAQKRKFDSSSIKYVLEKKYKVMPHLLLLRLVLALHRKQWFLALQGWPLTKNVTFNQSTAAHSIHGSSKVNSYYILMSFESFSSLLKYILIVLGHFRCHKWHFRTLYGQKGAFEHANIQIKQWPIEVIFDHKNFTSGLNMSLPVHKNSFRYRLSHVRVH